MTLIEHRDGILCPQSMPPIAQEHLAHVSLADRAYEAAGKDAEGELTPESAKIQMAISENWMRLYHDYWLGPVDAVRVTVESYYWRCQVCGFVLPAQAVDRRAR